MEKRNWAASANESIVDKTKSEDMLSALGDWLGHDN